MKQRWMRLYAMLLTCCLLLGGCNATEEPTPQPDPPVQEQPTPDPVPEPEPEPAPILPDAPQPDDITYLSALEPAPAAPEGFEIAAVLEYLCSTAFGGRQTGSDGCLQAGRYIAGLLEDWGYQPLFEDSLLVPYTAVVGDPALAEAEVILHFTGGDITLTEGVDYVYTFHPEGFDVKLPISDDPAECRNGEAAYLWSSGGRADARIVLRKIGGVISSGSDVWGAGNDRLGDLRVTLSDNAFAVAEQATHVTLRMKASAKEMERENVCAVLPGADRTQAMVLCGHFDGTGTWGEVLYPSAHDNASGTVTLLECARQLAGENLPFDLVICAFSGEEQHLMGSAALAPRLERRYRLLNVINLDCLGCGVADSLKLLGDTADVLSDALTPYLQQAGYTSFQLYNGASDQDSFTCPAIGLCEMPEGSRFHQPNDTVDTIDPVWLQKIADAVCSYVCEAAILEKPAVPEDPFDAPSDPYDDVMDVWQREKTRKQLTEGLAYDQGFSAVADYIIDEGQGFQVKALTVLYTAWDVLKTTEEVQTYYPKLDLPETIGDASFFGAYVVPNGGAIRKSFSSKWEAGKQYAVNWDSILVDELILYYCREDGSGYCITSDGSSGGAAGVQYCYSGEHCSGFKIVFENHRQAEVKCISGIEHDQISSDGIYWRAVLQTCDKTQLEAVAGEVQSCLPPVLAWLDGHQR